MKQNSGLISCAWRLHLPLGGVGVSRCSNKFWAMLKQCRGQQRAAAQAGEDGVKVKSFHCKQDGGDMVK